MKLRKNTTHCIVKSSSSFYRGTQRDIYEAEILSQHISYQNAMKEYNRKYEGTTNMLNCGIIKISELQRFNCINLET